MKNKIVTTKKKIIGKPVIARTHSNNISSELVSMASQYGGNESNFNSDTYESDAISRFPAEIRNPTLNPEMFFLPKFLSNDGSPNIELNTWFDHYYRFHPLVGNLIDLHKTLPLSRFGLVGINDSKMLQEYEEVAEDLQMFEVASEMFKAYFLRGEYALYGRWNDDIKSFNHLKLLDTNYINVTGHYLLFSDRGEDTEVYELTPDEYLQSLVNTDNEIYQQLVDNYLDDEVRDAIENNFKIMLDPFTISFEKRTVNPWDLRGTSILCNILKTLILEDKLREYQYANAQANTTPIYLWNIGDGDYPADDQMIQQHQSLIQNLAYDPNKNIIANHLLKLTILGASGQAKDMHQDFEYIQNLILTSLWGNKAFTTCFTDSHEYLTEDGWKYYDDITEEDKLATFNPETRKMHYENFINRFEYVVDEEIVNFENNWIDLSVTKNHKLLVKEKYNTYNKKDGDWKKELAGNIKYDCKLPNIIDWDGTESPSSILMESFHRKNKTSLGKFEIEIDDYLKLIGYFLSEGSFRFQSIDGEISEITITQQKSSKSFIKMKELFDRLDFFKFKDTKNSNRDCWHCSKKSVSEHFYKECNHGSKNKKIPRWILNLSKNKLEILLEALMDGDGSRFSTLKSGEINQYRYHTISKQLADDVQEIVMKLGYAVKVVEKKRDKTRQNIYWVCWGRKESEMIRSGYSNNPTVYTDEINYEQYKGRVTCFEMPTYHTLIVRNNGKVVGTFQSEGITYNSSSTAMRVLMGRYIPIRNGLENIFYRKIFLPIAIARGYYKRTSKDNPNGKSAMIKTSKNFNDLVIPKFDWRHKQSLMDDANVRSMLIQLHQMGKIPFKTICDSLDLDYDYTMTWLEKESNTLLDPYLQDAKKTLINSAVAGGLKDKGEGMMKRVMDASASFMKAVIGKSPNVDVIDKGKDDDKEEDKDKDEEKDKEIEKVEKLFGFDKVADIDNIIKKNARQVEKQLSQSRKFKSVYSSNDLLIQKLSDNYYDKNFIQVVKDQLYDLRILLAKQGTEYINDKTSGVVNEKNKVTAQSCVDYVLSKLKEEYNKRLRLISELAVDNTDKSLNKDAMSYHLDFDKYALNYKIDEIEVVDKSTLSSYWKTVSPRLEIETVNNFVDLYRRKQIQSYRKNGIKEFYVNGIKTDVDKHTFNIEDRLVPDNKYSEKKTIKISKNFSAINIPTELIYTVNDLDKRFRLRGKLDYSDATFENVIEKTSDYYLGYIYDNMNNYNDIVDLESKYSSGEKDEREFFIVQGRKYLNNVTMNEELKDYFKNLYI